MAVNTEKDDLKRAIAKLGGIQLEGNGKQAAYLFGSMAMDAHADRQFNFVPGVGQVFKRAAGIDVDRVISYLVELDYLQTDNLTEFEEKLRQIIGGAVIWSAQKSEYDYDMEGAFMAQFEAPTDDELQEEYSTCLAIEEDASGDILAVLIGDADELSTEPYDLCELPPIVGSREPSPPVKGSVVTIGPTNSQTGHELPVKTLAPWKSANIWTPHELPANPQTTTVVTNSLLNGFDFRQATNYPRTPRAEWIRARLAVLPPESIETVKRIVTGTLENMERKRGIDLTAEKRDISDA